MGKTIVLIIIFLYPTKYLGISTIWSENELNKTKTLEETRYKWYQEKINGECLYDNNKDQFVDKNNKIITHSKWDMNCDYSKNIEKMVIYKYRKLINIEYIKIKNICNPLNLTYFNIYNNDQNINYMIYKMEGVIRETNYQFVPNGYIIIKLSKKINIEDLRIKLISNNSQYMDIILYKGDNFNSSSGEYRIGMNKTISTNLNWLNENSYTDYFYSETPPKYNRLNLSKELITLCREKNIQYYFYNIEKNYYDDNYYKELEGYTKDINSYKKYYLYLDNLTQSKIEYLTKNNYIKTGKKCETSIKSNQTKKTLLENNNSKYQNLLAEYDKKTEKLNNTKYILFVVLFINLIFILFKISKKIVG